MKKIYLSLSAIAILFAQPSYAQWTADAGNVNIYNTNTGNVGIGTTSPSSYFHGGNNKVLEIFNPNTAINSQSHLILSTNSIMPGSSAGTITWVTKGPVYTYGLAYIASIIQGNNTSDAYGNLIFATANGTGPMERMRIDQFGNIGVGTTDPRGYKLAVAGNMIAEQVTVKLQASWPDYVFKKDYSLMPLSELRRYINQNDHLPEIPADKEIKEKGLNLGEMNTLLMKKIEELTLYLLEKDKQLKEQEVKINRQEERLDKFEAMLKEK